jgi:hypothetical protein
MPNYVDLGGATSTALIIIIFLVVALIFVFIMWRGVDSRFPKQKFMIYLGKSNQFRWGTRRIIENRGIIADDIISLMLGKAMVAQPLQSFENSRMYDAKGQMFYVGRKLADETIIPIDMKVGDEKWATKIEEYKKTYMITPVALNVSDEKDELRIEAYKEANLIATEYINVQDQIKKTTDAVNPFFAVLLPALPMIAVAVIVFIGIYLIVGNLSQAMVQQTDILKSMITTMNDVMSKVQQINGGGSSGPSPATNGVVIGNPSVGTTAGIAINNATIPSNLPLNAR